MNFAMGRELRVREKTGEFSMAGHDEKRCGSPAVEATRFAIHGAFHP
jgi:hypothetical protein